jgi:hypothetical protein
MVSTRFPETNRYFLSRFHREVPAQLIKTGCISFQQKTDTNQFSNKNSLKNKQSSNNEHMVSTRFPETNRYFLSRFHREVPAQLTKNKDTSS